MSKEQTTAGQTAMMLICIANYEPSFTSYAYEEYGLMKVERILVMADPCGELSVRKVLVSPDGSRSIDDEDNFIYGFSTPADNIISSDDVDYIRWYNKRDLPTDEVAYIIKGEIGAWFDTVQQEDGSLVPLEEYVNKTVLEQN